MDRRDQGQPGVVRHDQPHVQQPVRRRRRGGFVRFVGRVFGLLLLLTILGLGFIEARIERAGPIPPSSSDIVLIVGSDTREDLPEDLEGRFGDFAGDRADVIILANPTGADVKLLSLPRDLKVDVPGEGTQKINAAYAFGGLDLLAQTIAGNLSVPISSAMRVDFGGFAEIVDAVGGVELDFEGPTRDEKSGLMIEEPGVQTVDGATALAFVRSRSTEIRDGDEWRSMGGGDVERTARQREVLAGIADSALSPEGIVRSPLLINAITASLAVDDATHSWDLALLAIRMALAQNTSSESLPVVGSTEGGVAYVLADGAEATQVLAEFVND